MRLGITLKALAIWAGILVLAILNGALREAFLIPQLGTVTSQILSGATLSIIILLITYLTLPWLGTRHSNELIAIGLSWLALTLVFEFGFGLWRGMSWQLMLAAYTFEGGNIWPIVLVVTTLAPKLTARARGCF